MPVSAQHLAQPCPTRSDRRVVVESLAQTEIVYRRHQLFQLVQLLLPSLLGSFPASTRLYQSMASQVFARVFS